VIVKGKEAPVTIYEPLGVQGEVAGDLADEVKLWAQALRSYRSQDWDMAELQLLNLLKAHPSRTLYRVFLDRIAAYRRDPPVKGWDGAYRFETK
jgi:adenylate cyclase